MAEETQEWAIRTEYTSVGKYADSVWIEVWILIIKTLNPCVCSLRSAARSFPEGLPVPVPNISES